MPKFTLIPFFLYRPVSI